MTDSERTTFREWRSRLAIHCLQEVGVDLTEVVTEEGLSLAREYWRDGLSGEEFLRDYMDRGSTEESELDAGFDPRFELGN